MRPQLIMASLLAPSEVSSFLTCFTRLIRTSTIPTRDRAPPSGRIHCPSVFNRFFCSFTSLVLVGTYLVVSSPPPRSGLLRVLRPFSPFPHFKPHSSHTGLPTAPLLPTPAAVFTDHPFHAFYPYILSCFERSFTVSLQPSPVTGLQATSKTKSAALNRSFV